MNKNLSASFRAQLTWCCAKILSSSTFFFPADAMSPYQLFRFPLPVPLTSGPFLRGFQNLTCTLNWKTHSYDLENEDNFLLSNISWRTKHVRNEVSVLIGLWQSKFHHGSNLHLLPGFKAVLVLRGTACPWDRATTCANSLGFSWIFRCASCKSECQVLTNFGYTKSTMHKVHSSHSMYNFVSRGLLVLLHVSSLYSWVGRWLRRAQKQRQPTNQQKPRICLLHVLNKPTDSHNALESLQLIGPSAASASVAAQDEFGQRRGCCRRNLSLHSRETMPPRTTRK